MRPAPRAPTSPGTLSMGPAEWAMLLALSVLWGVVALTGRPVPRRAGTWLAFLGMGLLNNALPFGLIVWGQQTIASGLAAILNATTPLFTVAVAGLLLSDERIDGRRIAGIAAGFAGVVVMIGPGALSGLGAGALAQIACLGGALSYALAGVFGRRFGRLGVDPVVVAAGQVTGSTLLLAPLALAIDRPWSLPMPAPATWGAILGLAVLSTALAYILYFRILARAGATNLLLVTFLIPVSAIALGVLVLGERLGGAEIAGMALIGAGLLAIDGRVPQMVARRFAPPRGPAGR